MTKANNYRRIFKQHYGIEFGTEFDVHHIDGDRSNNEIENLMVLPSDLHTRYHSLKREIEGQFVPTKITGNGVNNSQNCIFNLEKFLEVLRECNEWYDYKMYLDGKIPNIHNKKLR